MSSETSSPFLVPAVMLVALTLTSIPLAAYLEFTKESPVIKDNAPDVYFGSGIKLQVSEERAATVFGYDECPISTTSVAIFAIQPDSYGCTLLTGNDSVKVRLLNEDGSVVIETWSVVNDKEKYSVMTQDGFLVRPPV